MNILVFDTETIGIEKAFCYDIGYVIVNTDTKEILVAKEFVIEQIWSNKPLFETAYYADKKPLYVGKMRSRKAKLTNWGSAIGAMIKDIKQYEVEHLYAYNSNFDCGVFDFNADWYKTRNPLNYGAVHDIWGYTSFLIVSGMAEDYVNFALENKFISDSGNLQNNADTWGKFFNGLEWNEEHTALEDSKIESQILLYCIDKGLEYGINYKVIRTIPAPSAEPRNLTIVDTDGTEHDFEFVRKTEYKKNGWKIVLKK